MIEVNLEDFVITDADVSTLNRLVQLIGDYNKYAGWRDKPRSAGEDIALIHSEVSEALEGFRKGINDDHLPHRKMAEVELADTVIRIFDTCEKHGFDLGNALREKFVYNQSRKDHTREARQAEGGKKF